MKRVLLISILLIICSSAFSQSEHTSISHYTTGINTQVTFSKETKVSFYFNNADSDSNKPSKTPGKRKRPKGTEINIYLINEYESIVKIRENDFIFSSDASYYFQLLSSNGERGPPLAA